MAGVQKVLLPINFQGGIDTKSDKYQVAPGKLTALSNGMFMKTGQLSKRYGHDALGTNIEGGGNILNAEAISSFNQELVLFDGSNVYSYVSATGNWLNRGTAISVIATDEPIVRTNTTQQLNSDVAFASGVEVHAWEDSSDGGVHYSVVDASTRAFAVANQVVYSLGKKPKVIAFGGLVYIFYADGVNNLFYNVVNPKNPTVLQGQVSLITDGLTSIEFGYDVTVVGNRLFIAYLGQGTGSGAINLTAYTAGVVFAGTAVVDTGTNAYESNESAVNVVGDSSTNVWVSWATGTHVRTARYSFTLVQQLAPTNATVARVENLTGIESTNLGSLLLSVEIFAANPNNTFVGFVEVSSTGSLTIIGQQRSVGLQSKAFASGPNRYVNVAFESAEQSTYFTLLIGASKPKIIARINPGLGQGLRTNNMLSEVVETDADVFLFGNGLRDKLITEAGQAFSLVGVNSTSLDFQHPNKFLTVTQSNNLLIVGGILSTYDGVSVVECGYHVYPEGVTAVAGGSGGFLGTGQYQYVAIYKWTDNEGQVQLSATSDPVTVTPTASQKVSVTIPTLRLTAKQGNRSPVAIAIYRTSSNGVTFTQCTDELAPELNNTTVDSITFVDGASDADIAANEVLYTTGGILDNMAPPANKLISLYQNRVIVGGLEDPNLLWYSKNKFDSSRANTIPVEFSEFNTIGVDPRGGSITALASLDANLVIFKKSMIFALQGDGPNDTGTGDVFPDATPITSDVGCENPNSVVVTPVGLMFQSAKGIYLLDRSISVSYIGAPVEAYNGLTITSSTLLADANQVIFTTNGGPVLVYDYFFQQWSVWTGLQSEDSDVWQGSLVLVKPSGKVFKQNKTLFTDDGQFVPLSFEMPWMSLAGLSGYQRVFRAWILGTYKGPHKLSISVGYDGSDAYTQFATVDASANVSVWGGDPTWGYSSPWGGEYVPYIHRVDFAKQSCTNFRIKISDSQQSPYNEGYSISAITIEWGQIPGGHRVRQSRVVGAR